MTLTERRKLLAEATPGLWQMADPPREQPWSIQPVSKAAMSVEQKIKDAHLFIAAVNDYAKLLDVVEIAQRHLCTPHISQSGTTRWCRLCEALAALNLEEGR